MPKVERIPNCLRLRCDDPADTFVVSHTTMGEPYREGVQIGIENDDFQKHLTVMLEDVEAVQLRDFLIEHYPPKK
jgi:hypothetical protein